MKTKLILTALVCAFVLGAAPIADAQIFRWGRGERIRGSGHLTTEDRDLKDFTVIKVNNATDIDIKIGPEFKATLEAEDNLLDYITTEVRHGVLYVDTEDGYSISSRYGSTLEITMPELEGLEINGSSDVNVEGLDSKHLIIDISGSGDVDLAGQAGDVEIEIDGSGDVDGREFSANEALVTIDGSGDVRIKVVDYLDVDIDGSGDVTYYGDPKVHQRIRGSGDLRQRRP